jgi:hypothetical protein
VKQHCGKVVRFFSAAFLRRRFCSPNQVNDCRQHDFGNRRCTSESEYSETSVLGLIFQSEYFCGNSIVNHHCGDDCRGCGSPTRAPAARRERVKQSIISNRPRNKCSKIYGNSTFHEEFPGIRSVASVALASPTLLAVRRCDPLAAHNDNCCGLSPRAYRPGAHSWQTPRPPSSRQAPALFFPRWP